MQLWAAVPPNPNPNPPEPCPQVRDGHPLLLRQVYPFFSFILSYDSRFLHLWQPLTIFVNFWSIIGPNCKTTRVQDNTSTVILHVFLRDARLSPYLSASHLRRYFSLPLATTRLTTTHLKTILRSHHILCKSSEASPPLIHFTIKFYRLCACQGPTGLPFSEVPSSGDFASQWTCHTDQVLTSKMPNFQSTFILWIHCCFVPNVKCKVIQFGLYSAKERKWSWPSINMRLVFVQAVGIEVILN